jgi:elongation factor Ts
MSPAAIAVEDVPDDVVGSKEENALLTQAFIKDSSRTINDLVREAIAQTGENIRVARISRFELGG